MSVALHSQRWSNYRWRRSANAAGAAVLSVALLIWWLLPLYNMLLIALDPEGDTEFKGDIWPSDPTLKAFAGVFFEGYWYLKDFWRQFGNSFFIGAMTMVVTALISSLGGFALGRLWRGKGGAISTAALLLYTVPIYFLVIPFYLLMNKYGLIDTLWAVDPEEWWRTMDVNLRGSFLCARRPARYDRASLRAHHQYRQPRRRVPLAAGIGLLAVQGGARQAEREPGSRDEATRYRRLRGPSGPCDHRADGAGDGK